MEFIGQSATPFFDAPCGAVPSSVSGVQYGRDLAT
jgi:hypothetical protein